MSCVIESAGWLRIRSVINIVSVIVGFWRADRAYFKSTTLEMLSVHQWLALGIFVAAFFAFIGIKVGSKAYKT